MSENIESEIKNNNIKNITSILNRSIENNHGIINGNGMSVIFCAADLDKAGYRKQENTVKEFANTIIAECEHLQEHCEDMNNSDAYDYVEILIAEINRLAEQYGKEE